MFFRRRPAAASTPRTRIEESKLPVPRSISLAISANERKLRYKLLARAIDRSEEGENIGAAFSSMSLIVSQGDISQPLKANFLDLGTIGRDGGHYDAFHRSFLREKQGLVMVIDTKRSELGHFLSSLTYILQGYPELPVFFIFAKKERRDAAESHINAQRIYGEISRAAIRGNWHVLQKNERGYYLTDISLPLPQVPVFSEPKDLQGLITQASQLILAHRSEGLKVTPARMAYKIGEDPVVDRESPVSGTGFGNYHFHQPSLWAWAYKGDNSGLIPAMAVKMRPSLSGPVVISSPVTLPPYTDTRLAFLHPVKKITSFAGLMAESDFAEHAPFKSTGSSVIISQAQIDSGISTIDPSTFFAVRRDTQADEILISGKSLKLQYLNYHRDKETDLSIGMSVGDINKFKRFLSIVYPEADGVMLKALSLYAQALQRTLFEPVVNALPWVYMNHPDPIEMTPELLYVNNGVDIKIVESEGPVKIHAISSFTVFGIDTRFIRGWHPFVSLFGRVQMQSVFDPVAKEWTAQQCQFEALDEASMTQLETLLTGKLDLLKMAKEDPWTKENELKAHAKISYNILAEIEKVILEDIRLNRRLLELKASHVKLCKSFDSKKEDPLILNDLDEFHELSKTIKRLLKCYLKLHQLPAKDTKLKLLLAHYIYRMVSSHSAPSRSTDWSREVEGAMISNLGEDLHALMSKGDEALIERELIAKLNLLDNLDAKIDDPDVKNLIHRLLGKHRSLGCEKLASKLFVNIDEIAADASTEDMKRILSERLGLLSHLEQLLSWKDMLSQRFVDKIIQAGTSRDFFNLIKISSRFSSRYMPDVSKMMYLLENFEPKAILENLAREFESTKKLAEVPFHTVLSTLSAGRPVVAGAGTSSNSGVVESKDSAP